MNRRWILTGVFVAVLVGAVLLWLEHPVCVPLSAETVHGFDKWQPIDRRTDRQLHGPIFQKRGAQWYQCKSWVSRQLFF